MRLGIASYSYNRYFSQGKMVLEGFIKQSFELGVDGVELNALYFEPVDERVRGIKRLLLSYGLDLSCVTVDNNFCLPEAEERRRQVELVKKWVDATVKLGSLTMRVNAGWPPGGREEDGFKWAVECLKDSCCYAEGFGLMLTLENHGGITATADQVLRILKEVNSDWLKVNLDTANFRQDTYMNIEKVAPLTAHVHAKTFELGLEWHGLSYYWFERRLDYRRIMEALRKVDYNGYLSLEYEGDEDPATAVPKSLSFLKKLV